MRTEGRIEREVAVLGDLSRDELAERWNKVYGCPPPKGVRRDLLFRAAAWHAQAKRLGGMSTNTRRLLKAAITDAGRKLARRRVGESVDNGGNSCSGGALRNVERDASSPLSLGTRLIRDWSGRSHVVDVIEGGFVYEAKVYRSLSAIARKITGAHWSGPRFFGL
jgi:hypothetical protein